MDQTAPTTTTRPVVSISAWDMAVTRIYQENRVGLIAAAARLVGRDHAADVAQEMFIRVWSNPDAFDARRGSLTHYMFMITRGMSIDRVRSFAASQARDTRDTQRSQPPVDDAGQPLLDSERCVRVRRALATLGDGQREVIMAAYFGHLTCREVAVQLGIPEGTVKSRIRLGLVKLRLELGRTEGLAA